MTQLKNLWKKKNILFQRVQYRAFLQDHVEQGWAGPCGANEHVTIYNYEGSFLRVPLLSWNWEMRGITWERTYFARSGSTAAICHTDTGFSAVCLNKWPRRSVAGKIYFEQLIEVCYVILLCTCWEQFRLWAIKIIRNLAWKYPYSVFLWQWEADLFHVVKESALLRSFKL